MANNKYKSKTNTLTTPTHTHSQRHAQRVPCLKKSTAFRPKGTIKRNAKEMGKYFSSSYHILFACVRDGSLIKNANANFNDGVKTNVYCLLFTEPSQEDTLATSISIPLFDCWTNYGF